MSSCWPRVNMHLHISINWDYLHNLYSKIQKTVKKVALAPFSYDCPCVCVRVCAVHEYIVDKVFLFRVRVAGEFSSGSNSVNIPNINLQRNHFNQWPGRGTCARDRWGCGIWIWIGRRDQRPCHAPHLSAASPRCNVPLSGGIDLPEKTRTMGVWLRFFRLIRIRFGRQVEMQVSAWFHLRKS